MQQGWRRFTDEEAGVDVTGAVAGRRDMTGTVENVDTVTLAVVVAAGAVAGVEATETEVVVRKGATEAEAGVRTGVNVAEAEEAAADAVAAADVTGGEEVGVAAAC